MGRIDSNFRPASHPASFKPAHPKPGAVTSLPNPSDIRSIELHQAEKAVKHGKARPVGGPPAGIEGDDVIGRGPRTPDNTWTYYRVNGELYASQSTKSGMRWYDCGAAPMFR